MRAVKAIQAGFVITGQLIKEYNDNKSLLDRPLPSHVLQGIRKELESQLQRLLPQVPTTVSISPLLRDYDQVSEYPDSDLWLENLGRLSEQALQRNQEFEVLNLQDVKDLSPDMRQQVEEPDYVDYEPVRGFILPVNILVPLDLAYQVEAGLFEYLDKSMASEEAYSRSLMNLGADKDFLKEWSNSTYETIFHRLSFFEDEDPLSCLLQGLNASKLALIEKIIKSDIEDKSFQTHMGSVPIVLNKKGDVRIGFCTPEIFATRQDLGALEDIQEGYLAFHQDYCEALSRLNTLGIKHKVVLFNPWNSESLSSEAFFEKSPLERFLITVFRETGNEPLEEMPKQIVHTTHIHPDTDLPIGVLITAWGEDTELLQKKTVYYANPYSAEDIEYMRTVNHESSEDFFDESTDLVLSERPVSLKGPFCLESLEMCNIPENRTLH